MNRISAFLLFVVTLNWGCSNANISLSPLEFGEPVRFETGVSATYPTSLAALLGNPAIWDGRPVSVEGVIRPDLHGIYLYMTMENCNELSFYTGVQIYIDEIVPAIDWSDLPTGCTYATVEGAFINTPPDPPQPDVAVVQDRPSLIHAKFVLIH